MKIEILESDVIRMIHEGKSREEVGTFYGLDNADTVALFKHEAFKGLRAKKQRAFIIVKDENVVKVPKDESEVYDVKLPVTGEIKSEITDELQDEDNSLNVTTEEEENNKIEAEMEKPAKWD